MSNSYTLKLTDGTSLITVNAGSVNGNVSLANSHDSDLLLYGRGSFNWGQGIEQNLIRLTQNWADVADNPTASLNNQRPKQRASNSNTGISKPLRGQTWYNLSPNSERLYVNIDGNNNVGSWEAIGQKHYLSLNPPNVSFQNVGGPVAFAGDVRLATQSPDLYVQSTGTNYIGNAHVIFQGNKPGNENVNTAVLYSSHGPTPSSQGTPDAIFLRKFMTRSYDVYDETGTANGYLTRSRIENDVEQETPDANAAAAGFFGLARQENKIGNPSNEMAMTDFVTRFTKPLRITGNSTGGVVSNNDVAGLSQETLTTKRVVEHLIDSQPDYVPMTGTKSFGTYSSVNTNEYMSGNLGIQARLGTSGPNSDARLIMGFTGTTTTDYGFVTLESHNPRFLANTKHSNLDAEPMYALGIEGSIKARMFVKRGHWDSVKFAGADPELHNPDNLKEWFGPPDPQANPADPPENKYGIKNDHDTFGILKYNNFNTPDSATISNGFIIFDGWIETVKDVGMIRTSSPDFSYSGDDPDYDRTLTTIQSVKGYVAQEIGSVPTGNYYTIGDNLTINTENEPELHLNGISTTSFKVDAANNDANILMSSAKEQALFRMDGNGRNSIIMRTDTSGANVVGDGDNVILFYTMEQGTKYRGSMGMKRNTFIGDEYVYMENKSGSNVHNLLELHKDLTISTRPIRVGGDTGGKFADNQVTGPENGKIMLQAVSGGVPITANSIHNAQFDDEDAYGILFKNSSGTNKAAILSDVGSFIGIYPPTPTPFLEIDEPRIEITETKMQMQNMELQSGGSSTPGTTSPAIDQYSNKFAHERNLYRLSNRLVQTVEMEDLGYYTTGGGGGTAGWRENVTFINRNYNTSPTTLAGPASPHWEFDFTDAGESWFSEEFTTSNVGGLNPNGHKYRIEVTYHIPYSFRRYASYQWGKSGQLWLVFRSGGSLGATGPYNTTGWDASIFTNELWKMGGEARTNTQATYMDFNSGFVSGKLIVPIGINSKLQMRFHSDTRVMSSGDSVWDFMYLPRSQFTAKLI